MEYWNEEVLRWDSESITPILHFSILLLSTIASSLQPQQRQHFLAESLHLLYVIPGGKTQHRRGDAHVDPFLDQSGGVFRRSVSEPNLDQALGRIRRTVIMIEIILRLVVGGLPIVVDVDHAVNGDFEIRQVLADLSSGLFDHAPAFGEFFGGHAHRDVTVSDETDPAHRQT